MKRISAVLLSIFILLSLAACRQETADTPEDAVSIADLIQQDPDFNSDSESPAGASTADTAAAEEEKVLVYPAGMVLHGIDVSGLTAEEAEASLQRALDSYEITLLVGSNEVKFSASEIGLTITPDSILPDPENCPTGADLSACKPFSIDEAVLKSVMEQKLSSINITTSGKIVYDSATYSFKVLDSSETSEPFTVTNAAVSAVLNAVSTLQTTCELAPVTEEEGEVDLSSAVAYGNRMLQVQLTYVFNPDSSYNKTTAIDYSIICNLLKVSDDGQSVEVDEQALYNYADALAQKHSFGGDYTNFVNHWGTEMSSIQIPHSGFTVDTAALYNDLYDCITNCKSGTRTATYATTMSDTTTAFGGTYIECDLNNQYLWFYKNGEIIVSTPFVSGCVADGDMTITGLYSIYAKQTSTWLTGPTWNDYVSYWMPFCGGYGLHDASWRSEWGGTIYVYDGSHGCINLPIGAASAIYSNASIGTHVILYGGYYTAETRTQVITGSSSYHVEANSGEFTLDATPAYDTTLTYTSSNPAVASVSADGVVTAGSAGTAVITVSAAEGKALTAATFEVTVSVESPCQINGHVWNDGEKTSEASCATDEITTYICIVCGEKKEEITKAASGHTWDEGTVTQEPTCGKVGSKACTCSVCGATESVEIPATGAHTYESGYCTVCGAQDPNYVAPVDTPE